MNHKITSYQQLIVWQKAIDLIILIYYLTKKFPTTEKFGLISQIRRSAVSIPANIAEGWARGTSREYRHFLMIALGSGAELQTLLHISRQLNFFNPDPNRINSLLLEIIKMLTKAAKTLQKRLQSKKG